MPLKSKRSEFPFLVLSTAPSRKEAEQLSQKLLNSKLAACVNVFFPLISFFTWKGKKEKVQEALLLIKTTSSLFPRVSKLIQKNHSYEVPEIIGWKIDKGNLSYLNWLKQSVH